MSTHHPFSPSVLGRRLLCPGSYRMEMAAPERESEDAARGTRLHKEMARCRDDWKTHDEEERTSLQRCWARVDIDTKCNPKAYVLREIYGTLAGTGDDPVTGTTDFFAYIPGDDIGYLYDWKFGRGESPSTFLALQLNVYAAMMLANREAIGRYAGGDVRYNVIRARAYYPETDQTFETLIGEHGVAQVVRAVNVIRTACESPEALLRPGPEQCRYCRAASGCPALETQIARVVEDPMPLTVEKRAKRREARLMIEKWCEAVQNDDKEFVRAGGEIPGWRMGARNGREYVSEPEEVIQRLAADLGPPVWDAVSVNLGELKRLWHVRHGGERKASDAALMAVLGAHVARSQGFEVLYRSKKEPA